MNDTYTIVHTLDELRELDGATLLACRHDAEKIYSASELIKAIENGRGYLALPAIVAVEASQHKEIRAAFDKISNRPSKRTVEEDVESGNLPLSALNRVEGLHQIQQSTFGNLNR